MKTVKMIVCCHKDDIMASSDEYVPLHVGSALSDKDLGIARDDEGDNISLKNQSYCELTGLYWAWKHLREADYVGLCHYRRYFDFHRIGRQRFPFTTLPTSAFKATDLSVSNEVRSWLDEGYAILPKAWHLRYSVYMEYCEHHYSTDFRTMGDVIREMSPDYYGTAIQKTMVDSNLLMPLNMFLMNREQMDKYCSWLFPILFEIERRIDISKYDGVQRRIFGYMGERMMNIYMEAEHIQYKQLPVLKFSEEREMFDMPWYKYRLRCMMNDLALRLTKY
jgi:hypothetical protein